MARDGVVVAAIVVEVAAKTVSECRRVFCISTTHDPDYVLHADYSTRSKQSLVVRTKCSEHITLMLIWSCNREQRHQFSSGGHNVYM